MRACLLLSSVLVAAAAPGAALAQPAEPSPPPSEQQLADARMHYQNAERAMQEGRYADAASGYGVAYEVMKDPILFYKIGVAHQAGGKCGPAVVYFRRYLRDGSPSEEYRRAVTERIATCEGGTAAPGPGADGGAGTPDPDPAPGPGGPADPGAADQESVRRTFTVTIDPVGPADPVAADGDPLPGGAEPSFLDEGASWQRTTGWILAAGTVGLATAGTILAMSGQSRTEDLRALASFRDPNGWPATYEGNVRTRYEDLVREGERFNTLATATFIAAGVTAVASITLLVLDARAGGESGSAITLAPTVGPDHASVTARLRF
jgi:hypothetical protein